MPAESPSPADVAALLAAAIALSGSMIEAAKAGDWERLDSLERERSRLLGEDLAALLSRVPAGTSAEIQAGLATCLRLNDEIAAITGEHMARLGELLAEMSRPAGGSGPPQRPPG